MLPCPLCQSKQIIRYPFSLCPNGRLFIAMPKGNGETGYQEVMPSQTHMVRGKDCWENGKDAYRGARTYGFGEIPTSIDTEVLTPSWQPLRRPANAPYGLLEYGWGDWGGHTRMAEQLAFTILHDYVENWTDWTDEPIAERHYKVFAEEYVSKFRQVWTLGLGELSVFIDEQEEKKEVAYGIT